MPDVILYTKPGCSLCDKVKVQLGSLRASHEFELREVNILDDPAAYAEFHDEIPVVFIDGRKAFKYHLDEKGFLRRLNSPPPNGDMPHHEG
jgi:glutaredoxin